MLSCRVHSEELIDCIAKSKINEAVDLLCFVFCYSFAETLYTLKVGVDNHLKKWMDTIRKAKQNKQYSY